MEFLRKKKAFWQPSDGITQSFIGEWLACRQRANLGYRQGWSSVTTSNALTFGTLFHACLEIHYLGKSVDIQTVLSDYKKEITGERLWTTEDEETLMLNQGYLEVLLPAYLKQYEKKDKGTKYLAVEKEFRNKWNGRMDLRGKMDIVFQNNANEIWVMDHKTAYSLEGNKEDRLSFDLQGMFYILNWWLEKNVLPTGFIQNIIQRPRLRKGKDETLKHFIDRVRADVDSTYFKRIQMTITKQEFEFWFEKEFKPIMDDIAGWAADLLPNYRNPSACETKYGSCRFSRVCGLKDFNGLYQRKRVFQELM